MSDILNKIFFTLYPDHPKRTSNEEGVHLRSTIKVCCILHIFFFVAALTLMGFLTTMTELGFSLWSFSCFLTLREWSIIIYMIMLLFSAIYGILNIFTIGTIGLLFYIMNLMFYILALYYILGAYKHFRDAGGIHGTKGKMTSSTYKKENKKNLKDNLID